MHTNLEKLIKTMITITHFIPQMYNQNLSNIIGNYQNYNEKKSEYYTL